MSPAAGAARRVLYVHHRPEASGASRALALLVGSLDRERYEPHVLAPEGAATELLRDAGAAVRTAPVALFTHIWASTYHGLRWALLARELARLVPADRALRRALRNGGFALVHLNDSPLVHAAWAARRARIPVVWHLRSALPGDASDLRSRLVRQAIAAWSARAVAINEDVAASFGVGAAVVPDPVDVGRFRGGDRDEERRQLDLPSGVPVVSFFGYLYPAKGYRELLEAAAVLRARGLRATWVLVGGAVRGRTFFRSPGGRALAALGLAHDHEREAKELALALGIAADVRFVSRLADPAPWFRASDLVVVPSQGPEIGLPALEAAAAGVAVVATGTATGGGVVVPGETGVLVPGRSVAALADTLGALLADDERRQALGEAGRRLALARFDRSLVARRLELVYDEVLGR